jgi:hypothetical protein
MELRGLTPKTAALLGLGRGSLVPVGEWELALDKNTKEMFEQKRIEDILFVNHLLRRDSEWSVKVMENRAT